MLVGTDGSEAATRAVRWAAREAARRGRALLVVHAYGGPDSSLVADASIWRRYQKAMVSRAHEIAAAAVTGARAVAPSVPVAEELVDGHAAAALFDRAADADLLVVGERGRGGFAGALVGSVAEAVAGRAAAPVVVVRGEEPDGGDAPVVVGVDGSPGSAPAIDFAAQAADAARCPLVAVHTWWDEPTTTVLEALIDRDAIEDDERRLLAEQLAGLAQRYPDLPVSLVVERAHPAPTLLRQARGARLVVVGSRGRGGFTGLLLGSVSRTMLHRAPCPVAIVPGSGHGHVADRAERSALTGSAPA